MTQLPLIRASLACAASLVLAACVLSTQAPSTAPFAPLPGDIPGASYARIGESVYVDGPKVTPLEVLEDSRCPTDVQCIQAGQVRLKVRIDLGSGSQTRIFTFPGKDGSNTQQIADGAMELISVTPERTSSEALALANYRFGFTFAGGL